MSINWSLVDAKRLQRANETKLKSIDRSAEQAVFLGSRNATYSTTLRSCTCADFSRHPYQPCKHMLRLAQELNRLDDLCSRSSNTAPAPLISQSEKRQNKKASAYLALSDYVVIDVEATDKNPHTAGILELAAVRVTNGCIIDTFSSLANPRVKNTPAAFAVNKITDEMIESAPPIRYVLKSFLNFVGTSPVVGHNISSYDAVLIDAQSIKHFDLPFENTLIDTLSLSRNAHNDMRSFSLASMCDYYGIVNENSHRALSDALCTMQLYEILKSYFLTDKMLSASFVFGGYSAERIYQSILAITCGTEYNLVLKAYNSLPAIYMFNSLAFTIHIDSEKQYLETSVPVAVDFVNAIPGASMEESLYRFPIASQKGDADAYKAMLRAVYEHSQALISGTEPILCSNPSDCADEDCTPLSSTNPSAEALITALRFLIEHNIPYIDKTSVGGALWVLVENRNSLLIQKLILTSGLRFVFTPNGGKSSRHKPAWYHKPSKK